MKRIIILFLLFVFVNANDYTFFFKKIGNYFNIDPLILETIAKIESNYQNNVINVNTNHKNYYKLIKFLKKENISYKAFNKKMVMFRVNKINLARVLNFLNKNKYSFDLGIMQINNFHAKTLLMQKLLLKNPFFNIYKGAKILRECFDKSKDAYQTISCYNTGSPYKLNKKYIKKFFDAFWKKLKKS